MAPQKSKQADRKAAKKPQASDEHPSGGVAAASGAEIKERVQALFMDSCLVKMLPKIPELVKEVQNPKPKAEKKEEKPEEKENTEDNGEDKAEEKKDTPIEVPDDAKGLFASLVSRLGCFNVLGLAEPASNAEAKDAWIAMKELELDFGPRAKKRGSPGFDRITVNIHSFFAQYLHVLLALMMVRAFLFRSWFACLPWLVGYQMLSTMLPLDGLTQLPQVPLEKVPVEARCVASLVIHALVWLFFVYEALWKTYFFEKIPLVGLVIYHAYAVRPQE